MPLARVPALRAGEQDLPAGHRRHRRERADDEPVVRQHEGRRVQTHDRRGGRPRRDLAALQRRDTRQVLRRAVVQPHLVARAQRPGAGKHRDPGVEAPSRESGELGRRQPVAPADVVTVEAAQVHAGAAAGVHHLGLVVVHLDAAHAGAGAAGLDGQHVSRADLARPQGAGDHRADALEREDAVHGQAGRAAAAARLGAARGALERGQQVVQAAPVPGAHGDDLAAVVGRGLEELAHVRFRQLQQFLVHDVRLGQRHDPVAHAQQLDDGQVLHRLRHDAVVGGDDQQEEVDAGRPGHHGAHEALVARHVDHAQPGARRQLQLRVAELDGDAALLLLAQPVGVLAGEPRDERRLAVVDVTGGAEGQRRTVAERIHSALRSGRTGRLRRGPRARPRPRRAGRRAGGRRARGRRRPARRGAAARRARRPRPRVPRPRPRRSAPR